MQSIPIAVDPAGRSRWRHRDEWQIWLGWIAAFAVHGGLLAALIFNWPARLTPPPDRSSISLVMLPAAKPAPETIAVQPKPPGEIAQRPATPTLKIAEHHTDQPAKPSGLPAKAAPAVRISRSSAASRRRVEEKSVQQQDGDGFVAAQPVAGSYNQPPEYPADAQAHGEQGDVLLSIHVLPNGEADSVSVTQSSGYDILDREAEKAVWKWRFQPSTLSGRAVPSVIPYRIHFELQNVPVSD